MNIVLADPRPREYAEAIGKKATDLIRSELEQVPKEFRRMVVDEVINSMAIDWELKKAKADKIGRERSKK